MESIRALDAAVHAYLRALPTAVRTGPFTIRFDEHDDALPYNYAIPDDGGAPTAADLAGLVAAFRTRARTPRLEYVPQAAPEVEAALLAAGFVPEGRFPLLVCPPEQVIDAAADPAVEVSPVTTDAGLLAAAQVMNAAFEAPEATEHDVARLRRLIERGGLAAAATDITTGEVVGAGQVGAPAKGVAEVAGIAVRASHRRRGIAGAVTAFLTRACAGTGVTTPFLTPADEAAGRVYERVGYRRAGDMLHISLPG
ncbi:GNAT family N-acetyltransferase [Nonomuraea typhae]|uniref:GNAT family N-acetyltransferase n=1 Tax=Nonomuraea typhae TaxID=2603600 RepID=A0ABW7Z7Z2_9ACTN